jgi:hypothetical protein
MPESGLRVAGHCYAESIAKRFWEGASLPMCSITQSDWITPLRVKKPRRIFVNSMSDLFHEDVSLILS